MSENQLSNETAFTIDFNLHRVPAAMGLEVPSAAAAVMMSISEKQFLAYTSEVQSNVHLTSKKLLCNSELAQAVDQLSVPKGGTMMTIGDSITSYRYGYAELLETMMKLRRSNDNIRFLNVAQSGYTSSHGLENVYTQFLAQQPDWVSIKFGVNDCKHFGNPQAETLVSLKEYRSNMIAMVEAFLNYTSTRPILITPTPVIEDVINNNPDIQLMRLKWNNDDIKVRSDVVKDIAQKYELPIINLMELFGDSPDPGLYLEGLHPGAAGHELF